MECNNCHKPAKQACSSCKEHQTTQNIVHYCGSACQKADWTKHKVDCRRLRKLGAARKSERIFLERVMTTAQMLFYIHRELTWGQLDIQAIEKNGEDLLLRGFVSFKTQMLCVRSCC